MSNVAKAEGDSGFAVGSDTNSSKEFRIKQKDRVKTLCSPWTVFDEIPAAMYGLSDLNEVALGNLMQCRAQYRQYDIINITYQFLYRDTKIVYRIIAI
jgi:hypothetical protein